MNDDTASLAPSEATSNDNQDGDDTVNETEKTCESKDEEAPKSSVSVTTITDTETKIETGKVNSPADATCPESAPSNPSVSGNDSNKDECGNNEKKVKVETEKDDK